MMTRGGEGGKKCRKFDDVICERPLSRLFFLIFPSEQQKQRYYIQATGCDDLLPVCNEVEEMEKMEKIKAHQEQYGAKRGASTKRGRGPEKQTFKRQTVHIIPNTFLLYYRTYCHIEIRLNKARKYYIFSSPN